MVRTTVWTDGLGNSIMKHEDGKSYGIYTVMTSTPLSRKNLESMYEALKKELKRND